MSILKIYVGNATSAVVNTIYVGLTAGVTDGVIGSGGAFPTGWGYSKTANITLTIVSHGGDDSVECFDLKIDATTAATSTFSLFWPNGFGGMPSSPGKQWKTGAYIKQIATSGGGINGQALSVHEADSGGGYLLGHDNYTGIPTAGAFQASYREITATLISGTVAKTDGGLYISQNAVSAPSSVTLRFAAKLEEIITAGRTKVWNGTGWVTKPVKVWSGSAWVEKPLKVWNGSAWV